jgi:hypothetical protein
LEDLKVQARYHRDRRDIYRAKMHGRTPTSTGRMRELERAFALADSRLRRAEREKSTPQPMER